MERVRLLWWRGEAVAEHDGDEALDALGGTLGAKVKGLCGCEGFAEDHHRLHVGVCEGLVGRIERRYNGCLCAL